MSANKDVYNFGAIQKKENYESITPHKISILLYIREFCMLKLKARSGQLHELLSLKPCHRRDFCTLVLRLIQCPYLELQDLKDLIKDRKYVVLSSHWNKFEEQLSELYNSGVGSLLDLISSLSRLMTEPTVLMPIVNKSSIIGLFLRRVIVHFEKLSFSQVVSIYRAFQMYYEKCQSDKYLHDSDSFMSTNIYGNATPLCTKKLKNNALNLDGKQSSPSEGFWSRRQADLFIAQQSSLMQNNEIAALPPAKLQEQIWKLLKTNQEYSEAHYLSYLNCLRVKEFCGAFHSLFHCFDRGIFTLDNKGSTQDEKNRGFRFAALNLAILYSHFGHKKNALAALKEAIMLAQESNDNICLQHALAWLYNLSPHNKEVLMERSISKSSELSLNYLTSLGIQSFAQCAAITAGRPSLVFELLVKSDVLNYHHSMIDLIANIYAQKAALWAMYGKTEMTLISSQLLLNLNMSHPAQGVQCYNGEGTSLAVCNIINTLAEQGEYEVASVILEYAHENFPHEPVSKPWILSEQLLYFTEAMHKGMWQEAEQAVHQLVAVDKWESLLRKVELLITQGNLPEAIEYVSLVLKHCQKQADIEPCCPALKVRGLILAAQLQPPAVAVSLLTSAAALAQIHHLDYLGALTCMHLANVQLQMNLPSLALKLIDDSLLVILSHGGYFDQARALLLMAKCKVAAVTNEVEEVRKQVVSESIQILHKVKIKFLKVEAYSRVKDVLYLMALLFNEIGSVAERKKCALEFRQWNEQYPTKIATTLLTSF